MNDAYDDCVADLDEQVGRLFDELSRRDDLEQTWVIVVSDHGESFGEHRGVFCHGTSLYQTELHVPLVIIPPAATPTKRIVAETREPSGPGGDNRRPRGARRPLSVPRGIPGAVLERQAGDGKPRSYWLRAGALGSGTQRRDECGFIALACAELAAGGSGGKGWSYIRRDGDGRARSCIACLWTPTRSATLPPARPPGRRSSGCRRAALSQATAGPLTPQRFKP